MHSIWPDVVEKSQQFRKTELQYWLNEDLFSRNWWILLIVTIVIFIVWLIILDKKRVMEIVAYGTIVATIATMGDTMGLSLLLWSYPNTLLYPPDILEIHNLLMPFFYMMVYQYFNTWKSFLVGAAINAVVFAFILEPLLVLLGIYEPYHWKHIYSVVPYFVIAIGLKWFINKLKQLDKNYK